MRSQPPAPASFPSAALTVPQAFDMVESAIRERACHIDVRYDAPLGYPADLYIDADQRLADEESGFFFFDLVVLR